jgi:hypothetical protein
MREASLFLTSEFGAGKTCLACGMNGWTQGLVSLIDFVFVCFSKPQLCPDHQYSGADMGATADTL